MILSQSLMQALEIALKDVAPRDYRVQSFAPISGGNVNRAFQLSNRQGRYLVKTNGDPQAMYMFLTESKGLTLLREATAAIHVPQPLTVGHADGEAFLLMAWVDAGDKQQPAAQEALGRLLATLHQRHGTTYGLDHDNFIARLPQDNTPSTDWTDFFISQRLQKQLDMAGEQLDAGLRKQFDRLFLRVAELYPQELPALLHGDLRSDNYLIDATGQPLLIDPAVYYGHREVDIAMTKLFGGFSDRFYAAYDEVYPLQPDWEARVDLWNLYPLLVHVNLFGNAYLGPLRQALSKYLS
ncbi:fructosamine kinase family protein [Parapedobacter sp. DT-150]|uniref:fructosamine kinase family protein n=1 Tax=Parapedobacter sp. DT-150 TaxID=3396162 RepID=UPI003F5401F6